MGAAFYEVCASGKSDVETFGFETPETTEEMTGMEVCKAKAQREEGPCHGAGQQSSV